MNIKANALTWWRQGFNVVAVSLQQQSDGSVAKKPLCEWSGWIKQRQTEGEFNAQPWDIADGFSVICSYPNSANLYLAVVDFDAKKVTEEAKKRGKELLAKFPITRMEETVSGGLHLVYLSQVKPNPISQFHDMHALELIAGPKLCIMAPSRGYRTLNDNDLRVVEDAEGLFYQILGVADERSRVNEAFPVTILQQWLNMLKPKLSIAGEGGKLPVYSLSIPYA